MGLAGRSALPSAHGRLLAFRTTFQRSVPMSDTKVWTVEVVFEERADRTEPLHT
jgi:hypothetical protein